MNTVEGNTWLALIALIAYLVGSFPTAYFVTKGMVGKDIRLEGSHNVGGMNAYSLIRSKRSEKRAALGLVTILLGDMGKGVLAIYLAGWLGFLGYNPALALLTASFFVILGHNYPLLLQIQGGGNRLCLLPGNPARPEPLFAGGVGRNAAIFYLPSRVHNY